MILFLKLNSLCLCRRFRLHRFLLLRDPLLSAAAAAAASFLFPAPELGKFSGSNKSTAAVHLTTESTFAATVATFASDRTKLTRFEHRMILKVTFGLMLYM
jgi:hypothetical protein